MSNKNHKGQSMVEFAFIIPLFMLMCFGMIYGGIFFMDYLQYNRAAGAIARDISLLTDNAERNNIIKDINGKTSTNSTSTLEKYSTALTNLYSATFNVTPSTITDTTETITVKISFTADYKDLPNVLRTIGFPPESISPVVVTIPLRKDKKGSL